MSFLAGLVMGAFAGGAVVFVGMVFLFWFKEVQAETADLPLQDR